MSSRTWWKVAQVAAVFPVLALLASCVLVGQPYNAASDHKVRSLEQRVALLEQRDAGTDVEAVRAELQALAAKVGQFSAPLALDEAQVAAIAERQAAATVERSIRRFRAELADKRRAMGSGFAGRATRDRQPPARETRRPQPQKMTMEQRLLRKTEMIAQRAGLGAEQAQALGKIMMASWQGNEQLNKQLKEKFKAKEITREEYIQARKEARRKDLEVKKQFVADLDVNQREVLERALGLKRPGKREKKADAEKQKRRGKKKGRRAEER